MIRALMIAAASAGVLAISPTEAKAMLMKAVAAVLEARLANPRWPRAAAISADLAARRPIEGRGPERAVEGPRAG
jgi:hypothetical protein